MHLANLTTARLKRTGGIFFTLLICSIARAQDNSPYSRFGIGDVVPNQNVISRGMGGISAGYSDVTASDINGLPQIPKFDLSINLKNPASLGSLTNRGRYSNTIFDLGGEIDVRTLKSTGIASKYTSTNTLISYLQVAFPITSAKMERRGINWGVSFGLRPVTRISYKVAMNERLTIGDSLNTVYEGSGGVNQANVSTGIRIKNFSIGVSSGYTFGNKDYSTQKDFINDTVVFYKSNTQTQAHFGGIFLNTGIQYIIPVRKKGFLKLGAFGDLPQILRARQDFVNETFAFDGNGGIIPIDTVNSGKDFAGSIKMPGNYGIGFTYQDSSNHWLLGSDFEFSNWDNYRYYGAAGDVQNSWVIRVGAEYYPAGNKVIIGRYWRNVKYRAGFYYGPDYIKLDEVRPNYAATLGASFPLTALNLLNRGDFVRLNTALEIGGRGNKQSFSFRENSFRLAIGISMNASWFHRSNYQ